jgi:hypothetical protein
VQDFCLFLEEPVRVRIGLERIAQPGKPQKPERVIQIVAGAHAEGCPA